MAHGTADSSSGAELSEVDSSLEPSLSDWLEVEAASDFTAGVSTASPAALLATLSFAARKSWFLCSDSMALRFSRFLMFLAFVLAIPCPGGTHPPGGVGGPVFSATTTGSGLQVIAATLGLDVADSEPELVLESEAESEESDDESLSDSDKGGGNRDMLRSNGEVDSLSLVESESESELDPDSDDSESDAAVEPELADAEVELELDPEEVLSESDELS